MNKDDNGNFNNIGRYWPVKGPQKTLYIPKTFVKKGINVMRMFELEGVNGTCPTDCSIDFVGKAQLGASTATMEQMCIGKRCPF